MFGEGAALLSRLSEAWRTNAENSLLLFINMYLKSDLRQKRDKKLTLYRWKAQA